MAADETAGETADGTEAGVEEPTGAWSCHGDIVGLNEIAERLGVSYYRVRRWHERRAVTGCPSPITRLKTGPLWDINDWYGWFSLWKLTRGSESWTQIGRA